MDVVQQPKLAFHGVDIINLQFSASSIREENLEIKITCDPKVFYPEDRERMFNIIMDLSLEDGKYFDLKLQAIGTFEFGEDVDLEMKKQLVDANAPAIMFPYIRSFITTLTSNMGNTVGPLVIPTQFFSGEIERV